MLNCWRRCECTNGFFGWFSQGMPLNTGFLACNTLDLSGSAIVVFSLFPSKPIYGSADSSADPSAASIAGWFVLEEEEDEDGDEKE